MEIVFKNFQENLVYHANIFNYDKTLFQEITSKELNLDFSKYSLEKQEKKGDVGATAAFLKLESKSQIAQLNTLISEQEEEEEGQNDEMGEVENVIRPSSDARKALRTILDMLVYSLEKFNEEQEKHLKNQSAMIENAEMTNTEQNLKYHCNNLTCCLLYLDGISMVNIDLIKAISPESGNAESTSAETFDSVLFDILADDLLKDKAYLHIKEIASHLLSMHLMMREDDVKDKCIELMNWTFNHYIVQKRENCLTSNLSLLLTVDSTLEYFTTTLNKDQGSLRILFNLMSTDSNINTIYEALFCMWNISNNKEYFSVFEDRTGKNIDTIVQVIRTNKIDKVARIGLMTIKNLLDSEFCVESLFNIKFMRTIDILLTNKWNDPMIKELLYFIYDYLEKNYKIMNSFDKYVKEVESGELKQGALHTTAFWEENYKEFETGNFENIRRLVKILQKEGDEDIEMKCIACFDLGEFARLYPGGASILDHFKAKASLLGLIQHKNLELKNRALVCLQKIMMRSLKK